MEVRVDYLAVLVAALSGVVIQYAWYSKPVLGEAWASLAKVNRKKLSANAVATFVQSVVFMLLMAFVLAHMSYLTNRYFFNSYSLDAMNTAFWLWLGISVPTAAIANAYEQKSRKLTLITVGFYFFVFMTMAGVLSIFATS